MQRARRTRPTEDVNPILGLDFGRARIGVAISDELQLLAHPLETIQATERPAARIAESVRGRKIDHVVAGIPKRMNGQIGPAATEVLEFVEKLRASLPCAVVAWDERLTTVAAHRALRDAGKKTRHTRAYVDQVAAQMILQSYLDSRAGNAGRRTPALRHPAQPRHHRVRRLGLQRAERRRPRARARRDPSR